MRRNQPVAEWYLRRVIVQIDRFDEPTTVILRTSKRGVPHLVVKVGKERWASVAWFGKYKFFRVFHPYPSDAQEKSDHPGVPGVVERIKELMGCKSSPSVGTVVGG